MITMAGSAVICPACGYGKVIHTKSISIERIEDTGHAMITDRDSHGTSSYIADPSTEAGRPRAVIVEFSCFRCGEEFGIRITSRGGESRIGLEHRGRSGEK